MSERGISPSLGSRMAARVEEMVDAAARDAAASAQRAEDERRELLAGAYEQAKDAFKEAAADARAAADERAARLAAMRRTIAERSELLIAEADVPDQVREQVEALLVALAETEAALAREAAVAAAPEAPVELRSEAEAEAGGGEEVERPGAVAATVAADEPFGRWRRTRFNGQLLAVMRMAVGGMSRDELERELDPALSPAEREALLDDVFGRPRSASRRARRARADASSRAPAVG